MTEVHQEDTVKKKLLEVVSRKHGGVPAYQQSFIDIHKDDVYYRRIFKEISFDLNIVGRSMVGPLLDIGSGCGTFLWVCKTSNIEAFGVEPDSDKIEVAKIVKLGGYVVRGVGEHLPFKDESFNLVTSMSVIEHVQEPAEVLRESLRVTSRKGAIHLTAPDYSRCFHEGHYDLFWLPLFPKSIAKYYLRFRGRPNVDYIGSVQYVTGRSIRRIIKGHAGKITDLRKLRISYMNQTRRQWLAGKIEHPELIKTGILRKLVHLSRMIGLSREVILKLCLGSYPILSLARKTSLSASVRYLIEK